MHKLCDFPARMHNVNLILRKHLTKPHGRASYKPTCSRQRHSHETPGKAGERCGLEMKEHNDHGVQCVIPDWVLALKARKLEWQQPVPGLAGREVCARQGGDGLAFAVLTRFYFLTWVVATDIYFFFPPDVHLKTSLRCVRGRARLPAESTCEGTPGAPRTQRACSVSRAAPGSAHRCREGGAGRSSS